MIYLVGAATAVVLVSCGGSRSEVAGEQGVAWRSWGREGWMEGGSTAGWRRQRARTRVRHPVLGVRPESVSGERERMPRGEREERECVRESGEERVGASVPVRWGSQVGWEQGVMPARVVPMRVRSDGTDARTVLIS